jgi:hypothetical protein
LPLAVVTIGEGLYSFSLAPDIRQSFWKPFCTAQAALQDRVGQLMRFPTRDGCGTFPPIFSTARGVTEVRASGVDYQISSNFAGIHGL